LIELSAENAAAYLEPRVGAGPWRITELGGGVSNTVLLAESADERLVLKQALGKLRVEQDWFSDRRRILRESGALLRLAPWLPAHGVPKVRFVDHENLLYGMVAAPAGAPTWKSQLLAGDVRPETGGRVGELLAGIARYGWRRKSCAAEFGDQTVFDQLRIDPYYRSTAARHPDLAAQFSRLMEASARRRLTLVHGDWSPKNFLVRDDSVMAIDFEVIHYGDPAFDTGFLLNHLVLKSFHRPQWKAAYAQAAAWFWNAYTDGLPDETRDWIERATIAHLGCLMLARIDGKSPAEYLREESVRASVRRFASDLIRHPPETVQEVFACM
jgi:5-methylthioribose kinase